MDNCKTEKDLNLEFAGFTGTEHYYRHWLPAFVYTDGIKMMAEQYQAYWLVDIPFSYQSQQKVASEYFQIWTITAENRKAFVEMRSDADQPVLIRQEIPLTDFPNGTLKMYYIDDGTNKVLLLLSEY